MSDTPNGTNGHGFSEAPTSFNVRYILRGFDCQLTIRSETGSDLLPKTLKALDWLEANKAEPTRVSAATFNGNGNGKQAEPVYVPVTDDGHPDPTWCALHSVAMSRREKNGQVWFSHKAGDSYCKGK